MGEVVELRPASVQVTEVRPLTEAKAHLVRNIDDAWEMMRWLSTKHTIGFDTETTGLSKLRDRPRLVQIGDEMDGWAIPFERWGGLVDDVVKRFEGEYVMHNAPFDWSMMHGQGITINRDKIHDTRIMAHVLSSTGPLGLKPLSQRYVDPRAAAAQEALDSGIGKHGGWTWWNVPTDYEPYWVYGALDPILTVRLKNDHLPKVEVEALRSYQLEMHAMWVCLDMELKGAKVDREYTADYLNDLTAYCRQTEQWCEQVYGIWPGSDEKVVAQLLADGVELTKRTGTGRYSVDKEVLGALEHPLAQAVLGRRRALKVVSTYLENYIRSSEIDGRVHPSINVVGGTAKNPFESGGTRGVRTGRMSMDDPNLQNVPIHTNQSKRIRNCFTATDEDHAWIKCDFDQIEMRIFAHLAQDPGLVSAFFQPVDVFTAAARDIFNEPGLSKSDDRRQKVKNSFYAKLYGAGVEQFAKTAGIRTATGQPDLPTAQAFLSHLDARYPGIRGLQRFIERKAYQRRESEGEAYVRSPLTNRKHIADEGREYALMNYMIQGTAGEILKMKMVECAKAGLGEYMILPVHDEIDLDVPKNDLSEVLGTLSEIMNDADLLDVPVTATTSVGPRWGDVEDL